MNSIEFLFFIRWDHDKVKYQNTNKKQVRLVAK